MRIVFCLALIAWLQPASAQKLQSLPSPLPASHVSDAGQLLAADTRAELDRLATRLDQAGRGQLAIVVVASTGGQNPRQAATEIFNRWGVGDRQRNDGSLILLARQDRKAEIVLGDGIDNSANRGHAQAVMTTAMVPRFRSGDYDQGLVAGATELLQRVYAIDLSRPAEQPSEVAALMAPATDSAAAASSTDTSTEQAGSDGFEARANPQPTDLAAWRPRAQTAPVASTEPTTMRPGAIALVLSLLAAGAWAVYWLLSRLVRALWWFSGGRWMARRCRACEASMQVLSETEDDAHLQPAELTEEKLRSVDYRVWVCPRCSRVDKLARRAWFSRYSNCGACGSRAVSQVSTTISSATRYSTGLVQITETCQNCHRVRTEQKVLPVLPPPSDNSSSFSSSSSSSSSWGGGSSSGGGASGSW
ncbi:MAG: YgcG family protein [Lysobacterales bacterium]